MWYDDVEYTTGHYPAFVFDLDGTLCDHGGNVSEEVFDALSNLQNKFLAELFICTGSSYDDVRERAAVLFKEDDWLVDGIISGLGSSFTTFEDGEPTHHGMAPALNFTLDDGLWMRELIDSSGSPVKTGEHMRLHTGDSYASFSIAGKGLTPEQRQEYIAWDHDNFERIKLVRLMREKWKDRYEVFLGGQTGIDIVNHRCDKESAIYACLSPESYNNTFFVGDGHGPLGGDEPVFKALGKNYVAVDRDTVMDMLEQIGWGQLRVELG